MCARVLSVMTLCISNVALYAIFDLTIATDVFLNLCVYEREITLNRLACVGVIVSQSDKAFS